MQRPKLEPGQEWVWEYPRPPRLERCARLVRVEFGGFQIARSDRAWRVLETSHPPNIYVPREDVVAEYLHPSGAASFCEWKGNASYFDVVVGKRVARMAAWSYARPEPPYEALAGAIAFYPGRVDACYLDDEPVRAQEGTFYGGWITGDVVGPFKGGPGTSGW